MRENRAARFSRYIFNIKKNCRTYKIFNIIKIFIIIKILIIIKIFMIIKIFIF